MEIALRTGKHETDVIEALPLGDDLFELLESTLFAKASLGDVVRVRRIESSEDGEPVYKLVKIVERKYKHFCWLIPTVFGASGEIYEFGRWLDERGGKWECDMETVLRLHLPSGEDVEAVRAELNARIERFRGSEEYEKLMKENPKSGA